MSAPPAPNSIERALDETRVFGTDARGQAQRATVAQAVWDALLAEGTIHAPDDNSVTQWHPFLAIPLPGAPQHNTHA